MSLPTNVKNLRNVWTSDAKLHNTLKDVET